VNEQKEKMMRLKDSGTTSSPVATGGLMRRVSEDRKM